MRTAGRKTSHVLLLFVLVAFAFAHDTNVNVVRRQDDGGLALGIPTSTSSSSDDSSSTTTSLSPTSSSSSDVPLSSSAESSPSVTSPPTTSSASTTSSDTQSQSSSSSDDSSSSSSSSATSSPSRSTTSTTQGSSSVHVTKKTTLTSALVAKTTVKSSHTIATTINGKATSQVVETDRVVSHTTGFATSTLSPSLSGNGDGDSSSNGLSSGAKKIIGGIVGTIGGVMLLGGIGIVIWRIYGRKRHYDDMDDADITSMDNSIRREKRRASNLPFTGNLEQYHQPSARVNVGSNF